MDRKMLLVAVGCGRSPGMLDIASKHPVIVFGTMDSQALAGLPAGAAGNTDSTLPVYFYESG